MRDQFLRDITYLRVSLTDRCNFRCKYCMAENGISLLNHDDILTFEELEKIINDFTDLGITKIRLTGGEPLVRKGVIDFISKITKNKKITDIAMTTNGSYLKEYAADLKKAGLPRLNISLDTLNPDKFEQITRRNNFSSTIEGIKIAIKLGFHIKINCVLMRGINDTEILNFIEFGKTHSCTVRFIELMPIGTNNDFAKKHFISAQEIINQLDLIPCKGDDIHSPSSCFFHQNSNQKIGFITPLSNHFCHSCNRIRLTADGKIRPCLLQNTEYDLKSLVKNNQDLKPLLKKIIQNKPEKHKIHDNITAQKCMNEIGG
ncbi:MAG: GTP 3',8-cyclase MoaA [Treponemataceae bacterium]